MKENQRNPERKPLPDISLPENPTSTHVLRQQELVRRCREYQNHDEGCECESCSWVKFQLHIESFSLNQVMQDESPAEVRVPDQRPFMKPNKIKVSAGHYKIPSPSVGYFFVIKKTRRNHWELTGPNYDHVIGVYHKLRLAVSKAYNCGAMHP